MRTRQVQRVLGGVVLIILGCLSGGRAVDAHEEVSFLVSQDFIAGFIAPGRVGRPPVAVTVGDFNADGHLDLAIANAGLGRGTVSISLGQGDGTFRAGPDVVVGAAPVAVTVDDFNADGRLDLATANASGTVSLLLGQGDGTFQVARALGVGGPPFSVAVSAFNSDGHLDLATGNRTIMDVPPRIGTVSILLGQGDGTFRAAGDFFVSGRIPFLTVGDFNDDGRPDLVTQNISNFDSDTVSIFLGRGDGTFQAAPDVAAGAIFGSVTVADFNADGRLDLAIAILPTPINYDFWREKSRIIASTLLKSSLYSSCFVLRHV